MYQLELQICYNIISSEDLVKNYLVENSKHTLFQLYILVYSGQYSQIQTEAYMEILMKKW